MSCAYCQSVPVSPCPVCEVAPVNAPIRKASGKAPARPVVAKAAQTPSIAPTPTPVVAPAARQTACNACGVILDGVRDNLTRWVCGPCLNATPVAPHPSLVRIPCASTYGEGPSVEDRACEAIRRAFGAGKVSVGVALLVGLGDRAHREARLLMLLAIDQNAEIRGHITQRDIALRDTIARESAQEAGLALTLDASQNLYRLESPAPASLPWEHPAAIAKAISAEINSSPRATSNPPRALPAPRGPLMTGDWAELAERVKRGEISEDQAKAMGQIWRSITAQA